MCIYCIRLLLFIVFSIIIIICSARERNLWVQALTYFASKDFCREKISEVLKYIDQHDLLQPLMVVQLLAQYK